jgi:hypothetical protein
MIDKIDKIDRYVYTVSFQLLAIFVFSPYHFRKPRLAFLPRYPFDFVIAMMVRNVVDIVRLG